MRPTILDRMLGTVGLVRKAILPALTPVNRSVWQPVVREPYTGAWQLNDALPVGDVVSYAPVWACIKLIATDIAKLDLSLVEEDANGITTPVTVSTWSSVLTNPNPYQNLIQFIRQWITSKLVHGNAYILKARDARGVVNGLYPLDPLRVTPLVAPDGSVFYQLRYDDWTGLINAALSTQVPPPTTLTQTNTFAIPAREVIHDPMIAIYHPLVGVSPIYACALAASQGLNIQGNSAAFFANGSQPGGVLTAPGAIADETATRLKDYWTTNFSGANVGKVAVLGDGLKYEAMSVNAVDADLVKQLQWTAETVAACFGVPYALIGGPYPPYNNSEPLLQQYFAQCLQSLIVDFETTLAAGLELPSPYGIELDENDLIWMDTAAKTKAANDAIGGGVLSPNEARARYFAMGPVEGGDSPYMQQQYYSLKALAERDATNPLAATPPPPGPPASAPKADEPPPPDTTKGVDLAMVLVETLGQLEDLYAA